MELTTSQKQLKKVAGVLGILQGLAWTVMSLTCIILYLQKRKFFFPTSYMEEVNAVIYEIFLNRANEGFTQQLLTPRVFTGFMWVYFLIDVAWLLASVNSKVNTVVFIYVFDCLFVVLNKNGGELRLALRAWVYVTIIVCILDLITVIILGSDYEKCLEFMRRINSENTVYLEAECANGILPVLVITAKGFFFWIVNVIFARIIFKIAKRLKQPVRPVP
ncbi:uncharacterized protein BDFB_011330 [Asbolus verrucosus]|uniref:Uncharacterized protein n=1 Tax=Asbolus verrucosus TaxID=1661398 RepID=A0A482W188_ASBVE|nr:uncharacterized protein BDFB_011330 [Asbolus verrucosus]